MYRTHVSTCGQNIWGIKIYFLKLILMENPYSWLNQEGQGLKMLNSQLSEVPIESIPIATTTNWKTGFKHDDRNTTVPFENRLTRLLNSISNFGRYSWLKFQLTWRYPFFFFTGYLPMKRLTSNKSIVLIGHKKYIGPPCFLKKCKLPRKYGEVAEH